jgi:hypothetical protein
MKPQFCSIHLVFNKGYFEAVLIENTQRTLGVKEGVKDWNTIKLAIFFEKDQDFNVELRNHIQNCII